MSARDNATAAVAVRPEDERLSIAQNIVYGLQHILSMFGGVIAVPLIVGGAAGLEPAETALLVACGLFVSGLATMLQTLGVPYFGSQLPLVQGTSFASVATLTAIATGGGGLPAVFGAVMGSAVIGLLITRSSRGSSASSRPWSPGSSSRRSG